MTETTVFTAKQDIENASKKVQAKHEYNCGLLPDNWHDYEKYSKTYFLSPDGQCEELRFELIQMGYQHRLYAEPYHWGLYKDEVDIQYTEGDVYVKMQQEKL